MHATVRHRIAQSEANNALEQPLPSVWMCATVYFSRGPEYSTIIIISLLQPVYNDNGKILTLFINYNNKLYSIVTFKL